MKYEFTLADAKRLSAMSDSELAAWLANCRPDELLSLDAAFELWAQEGQLPPQWAGWRVWLMMAGRRWRRSTCPRERRERH